MVGDLSGRYNPCIHYHCHFPSGSLYGFFFSSRRRHTRCSRDWSSDVCSSDLLPKTNLISVTYEDSNPQRAAQVLHTLVDVYLEKHLAVHRPPGTFEFFQQQTEQHNQLLEEAESRLVDFSQKEGVVSPGQQKAGTLEKLSQFQSDLEQARVSTAETQKRIRILEGQAQAIPLRTTTQVRTADNPQLIEQLNTTLLNLQLKRTELLQQFCALQLQI